MNMENELTTNDITIRDIEEIFGETRAGAEEFFKFFSVLVPIVERDGRLYLLYEARAKHMKRQPGEICFPGGEQEPGEDAEQCALRETWEEIGVPREKITVISRLDTIYTYSNFAMYCFLGRIDESALSEQRLNGDEVEEVFFVSVDELLDTEPQVFWTDIIPKPPEDFPYDRVTGGQPYNWRKGRVPVPVYGEIDGRVIWGLTARITKRFIDTIRKHLRTGGSVHV